MNQEVEKLLYRPSEVAEATGYSRSKTYMLIASGVIPSIKMARVFEFPLPRFAIGLSSNFKRTATVNEPLGCVVFEVETLL